jgi:acetylornithine deacetylase/succinyl-diaminopimelate desuccinylase-like protein
MHSPDGKVAVPGFYDDVVEAPVEELAHLPPEDEDRFRSMAGVDELFGEPGYTTYQRTTARPTLEINGMWGGYQGQGTKTIVPSSAHAKITCRLVANQVPKKITELIKEYVEKNKPAGVNVELVIPALEAMPFSSAYDSRGNQIAAKVLADVYGKAPYFVRVGGSIPVLDVFKRVLGHEAVAFGFGLDDDRVHSPNEFITLSRYSRGQEAFCRLLEAFGAE